MKRKFRIVLLALTLLAAGVFISVSFRFLREEKKVDDCLSAKHGSFDYLTMSCDFESNHPYVPYHVRYPRDKQTALLAFVSFAAFLSAYLYAKNGSAR